ncbi:ceramide synthase 2-like [Periophthalmus magnuspinnatus]|uniref:ceramide synthase 2-like n=1 Tax=Periophthalmus magnuspinnatus TaxID=409849 RepID=UPI00145A593D|nr:ceramide synthase 2-like [Periophthalmus magnuspinnatus]
MDRMEAVLNEWIWRADLWLPPGTGWEDMEVDPEQGHIPRPRDLTYSVPLTLAFIACRCVFERVVAVPLSRLLGVKDRVRVQAVANPKLEAYYKHNSRQPSENEVSNLSKQCGLSQRKIQTWFRHRRNQDRPTNTTKFCEATWRFVFYLLSFIVGLSSLIKTPWFWDSRECWKGYPKQPVADAHYWYYMLELGFYLSLLLCVSVDVKRKDFREQVIHHIATIFLIGFSYCSNYVRVGTLVMLVHDSSDFFLESAKMLHYAELTCICDTLFVIFAVVFLFTRLVVFPFRVVHSTLIVSLDFFEPFFGYYFFNALLLVLQALHIFWAYLILRMVYKFAFAGKVEKDERSDEESEEEDEQELEDEGDGGNWELSKDSINTKLAILANNCVLNNLTSQRSINSRLPKAR